MPLPPLSLYIHIPWCIRKCPYCDFNSHKASEALPEVDYLNALIKDLEQDLHWVEGRTIQSIFIGGGTPSLMSADFYLKLMNQLHQHLEIDSGAEITMEANPGSFEAEKFAAYRQVGINRLSIGIQSFHPQQLTALGRVHNQDQALAAIHIAQQAGFENFNLDLMHGSPNQSVSQAIDDLETALSFNPPHLSWYQLTIEPNTEFYSRPPTLPKEDLLWDIQEAGQALLTQAGYQHYEISAFCQPNKESQHNMNYWLFGDYLGIGAGAHGKLTIEKQGSLSVLRTRKTRLPKDYLEKQTGLKGSTLSMIEESPKSELMFEYLMNSLRLSNGFNTQEFQARTGLEIRDLKQQIEKACTLGLLEIQGDQIFPSTQGKLYLNELLALFLPEPND